VIEYLAIGARVDDRWAHPEIAVLAYSFEGRAAIRLWFRASGGSEEHILSLCAPGTLMARRVTIYDGLEFPDRDIYGAYRNTRSYSSMTAPVERIRGPADVDLPPRRI